MKGQGITRRRFIHHGLAAGAAAGVIPASLDAAGYSRAPGANDQIRIGQIGCGGRNRSHTNSVFEVKDKARASITAACDIWRDQLYSMVGFIKKRFENEPAPYTDYRKLLESKDIDAVIIATPDHQHCGMLIDSVNAGKDVYIEKPIAMYMDELNRAHDAVKATKAVVQNGTQGVSSPGTAAARALHQSGKMGKLFRVESTETAFTPYWNGYGRPKDPSDTDWKAFLYGHSDRPFDADQHGSWMGYHEFSSGPIGGWMSHFSSFVHAVTGCDFPRFAVAQGGIFAPTSDKRRTAPDTVTVVLEYPEGFVTDFTTHFGSTLANESTVYFFEKGTLRSLFGHNPGDPVISGEGSEHPDRVKEKKTLECPPTTDHMLNWLECIRSRGKPNADMESGYKQGVAVILADMAYVAGIKMTFDPARREVRPA